MVLDDVLTALGEDGVMGRRQAEVPLDSVVGTVSRPHDFDAEFRLYNPASRERWLRVEEAMRTGSAVSPVDLVQLGELYFVDDGHHRVSVAKALGMVSIPARVVRICTVAYAMCCLRMAHLLHKAAEREFLERVPLPVEVRPELWLDEPAGWPRLADAAEAWGFRQSLNGTPVTSRRELAERWWTEEVAPTVDGLRAENRGSEGRGSEDGAERYDVQLYLSAATRASAKMTGCR
jgi:hypothetical protein